MQDIINFLWLINKAKYRESDLTSSNDYNYVHSKGIYYIKIT